jgi:hypothetical protein
MLGLQKEAMTSLNTKPQLDIFFPIFFLFSQSRTKAKGTLARAKQGNPAHTVSFFLEGGASKKKMGNGESEKERGEPVVADGLVCRRARRQLFLF